MRIAIGSNDRISQNTLEEMINEYSQLKRINISIDKFENGYDLLNTLKDKNYNIVFWDCKINDMDGTKAAHIIKEQNYCCAVILIGSDANNTIEYRKTKSFRLITKPIDKKALFNEINNYLYYIDNGEFFIINTHEGTWRIKLSEIIYAEATGKYTIIRTTKRTFELHTSLKGIEARLPSDKFCRCQRSYVVALFHVENYTNKEILFDNGERARIGRKYLSEFKNSFQDYVIWYNSRYI